MYKIYLIENESAQTVYISEMGHLAWDLTHR